MQIATSIWQKISLVFLSLFLSFALLEVGMRLGGFILLSIQEYGNLQSLKHKGTYRILCLGESTTERQYPSLLGQVLNERNIGVRFSVIDRGRGAKTTNTLLEEIGSNLAEYHPDMVVAMMGINDRGIRYYQDIPEPDTWLSRHCRVYRFGRILYGHILTKIRHEDIYGQTGLGSGMKATSDGAGTVSEKTDFSSETSAEKAPRPDLRGADGTCNPPASNLNDIKIPKTEGPLKKADKLFPENDMAYFESGQTYLDHGKFSQAEGSFKKAIAINPLSGAAYIALGRLYKNRGNFSQAEDLFKKAIEIYPRSDIAYAGLGELYMDYGIFSQAEDALRKSIELNPTNEFTLIELGSLYRDQDKLPQAEDLFNKAIDANFERVTERLLRAMASLYEEMGKPEMAKKYAERAQQMGSEDNAAITVINYRKLKTILDRIGIKLVCVQYPMRDVKPLKRIFEKDKDVIFVDNEQVFKEAVKQSGYKEYFRDMFASDFGHCTQKGNELLAQNIANVILREVFKK